MDLITVRDNISSNTSVLSYQTHCKLWENIALFYKWIFFLNKNQIHKLLYEWNEKYQFPKISVNIFLQHVFWYINWVFLCQRLPFWYYVFINFLNLLPNVQTNDFLYFVIIPLRRGFLLSVCYTSFSLMMMNTHLTAC